MADVLLTAKEAARRLGITVTTFYDWLGQSQWGLLRIQGQPVTINYFQSGPNGQGRIQIEESEIVRLRELMRVRSKRLPVRRTPVQRDRFPGITVPLGRPDRIG